MGSNNDNNSAAFLEQGDFAEDETLEASARVDGSESVRYEQDVESLGNGFNQQEFFQMLTSVISQNDVWQPGFFVNDEADGDISTEREYRSLLFRLRSNEGDPMKINIPSRNVILGILHAVDEFCEALVDIGGLISLTLGGADHSNENGEIENCIVWPKLELTDETSQAWDTLCEAIHTVCTKHSLEEVILGGYTLSGECIARVLQALRNTGQDENLLVLVTLPWDTISSEDYRSFVESLSHFQDCSNVHLDICGIFPDVVSREEYLAKEPTNHFQEDGILSEISCLDISFHLIRVSLNSEECVSLADILGSSSCSMVGLSLIECTVPDEFREVLVSSLSLNTSIVNLIVSDDSCPENALDILRHVALSNKTITHFHDKSRPSALFGLTPEENQGLLDALRRNHTLESIKYGRGANLFPYLTSLNKCGRRYLADDAASRSKCIAVLAKVKHQPDCLFFHLRENPILCTSYVARDEIEEKEDANSKENDNGASKC